MSVCCGRRFGRLAGYEDVRAATETTSPECAARYFDVVGDFDITDLLPKRRRRFLSCMCGATSYVLSTQGASWPPVSPALISSLPRSKPFVPRACAGLRSILRIDQPFPERPTGRGSVPPDVKDQVGLRLRTTVSSHSHRFKRSGHPFILTEFPSCDVNRCYLGRRFTSTPAVR